MSNILVKDYLKKTTFVHYGEEPFEYNKVEKISLFQNHYNKPKIGGIWLSPKNSKNGWKDWAKKTGYKRFCDKYRWEIQLKSSARILLISSIFDLKNLPTSDLFYDDYYACTYFDFEELIRLGFDGIFVCSEIIKIVEEYQTWYEGFKQPTLRFWNCETLLLFGKDKIENVTNFTNT